MIYEKSAVVGLLSPILDLINDMSVGDKVECLNDIREELHRFSPFKDEPVDFVRWVPLDSVTSNDYNPNKVAPPEMELLKISIEEDGYTQPVVTDFDKKKGASVVVDGFHRNRVAREYDTINQRVIGHLPVVQIRSSQRGRNNRIASTIRHNRARGKHQIDAMSDIVIELKNRNWRNARISKELGMDEDEILRLCQITGLSEVFQDADFSRSWNVDDSEADFIPITDDIDDDEREKLDYRTVNTSDADRIFHTFDKWECYKAGFYESSKDGMTAEQCEDFYRDFLRDDDRFRGALQGVITEWEKSCEHYLTNKAMNRIAWLGQASVCYESGIPCVFRGGFALLTDKEQDIANRTAWEYLNMWFEANRMEQIPFEEAMSNRQVNIY